MDKEALFEPNYGSLILEINKADENLLMISVTLFLDKHRKVLILSLIIRKLL